MKRHLHTKLGMAAIMTLATGWAINAMAVPIAAIGGDIVFDRMDGSIAYRFHVFTNAATTNLTVTTGGDVDVLIVGGGGGGGGNLTSSGGGGGVVFTNLTLSDETTETVTVGAGGAGSTDQNAGQSGANSVFGSVTAYGGGGRGANNGDGASGSGSSGRSNNEGAAVDYTPYQGHDGGVRTGQWGGGGGGGAGGVGGGEGTAADTGGDGGVGLDYSYIFGTIYGEDGWFGGGGGGCTYVSGSAKIGSGGIGGGGNGGSLDISAEHGLPNSGGGGGGGGHDTAATNRRGGDGGSGIVIVRYELNPTIPLKAASFTLANQVNGNTEFVNTNEVDVVGFPIPEDYTHYQITESGEVSAIDSGAWISTNTPPMPQSFALPSSDTNITLFAWFTNSTTQSEWIWRAEGDIAYTTNSPVASVQAAIERVLHPGALPVTVSFADIDDGTTGGEFDGTEMTFDYGLYCEDDDTPGESYVTLTNAGMFDVVLTVTNAAGSLGIATSVVTVTARTEPYLYVSLNGNNQDGISWATAFQHPATALVNAAPGDTIYLAGDQTFILNEALDWTLSQLTIEGGYEGTGTPGNYDVEAWPTVLERGGPDNHRILTIAGVNTGILRRVTVRNGHLTGNGAVGAGIHISASSDVLFDACNIISNRINPGSNANTWGAGLYASASSLTISNCLFHGNAIYGGGGASWGTARGGAIYSTGAGVVSILDSVIVSNSASIANNGRGYAGGVSFWGGGPHHVARSRIEHNISNLDAGGLYMTGENVALIENTLITDNSATRNAGGVWMNGGTLRSVLVARNTSPGVAAGGIHMQLASSRLENVTIVDNTSGGFGSIAGLNMTAGSVINTIIYHNTRTDDGAQANISVSGGTIGYSCVTPLQSGSQNTAADPEWIDRAARNYRLRPGSPLLNAGTNLAWMAGAFDLELESPRILNAIVDIGAYETDHSTGDLVGNFVADPVSGLDEIEVTLIAYAGGENTNDLHYWWDLDNSGVFDLDGDGLDSVSRTYGVGQHSVRLVISNAVNEVVEIIKENYIQVVPSTIYVSATATGNETGFNWDNAYTNLQDAIDAADSDILIVIAGGVYEQPASLSWGGQSRVTIRGGYQGVGAPGEQDAETWPTILRRIGADGAARAMMMIDLEECRLESVTLTGGHMNAHGGGLRINNSQVTIADCVISNNVTTGGQNQTRYGGGIYIENGSDVHIRRSVLANNRSQVIQGGSSGSAYGGGLHIESGCHATVESSVIVGNESYCLNNGAAYAAGVHQAAGSTLILRNCLIYDNETLPASAKGRQGAGVWLRSGGLIENSTIAANRMHNTDGNGAGLYLEGGAVTNTIVYGNLRGEIPDDFWGNEALVYYSCAPELTPGVNNNINDDPLFNDAQGDDFRLDRLSPGINAGITLALDVDLDGQRRPLDGKRSGAAVTDMGCYEHPPIPGSLFMFR